MRSTESCELDSDSGGPSRTGSSRISGWFLLFDVSFVGLFYSSCGCQCFPVCHMPVSFLSPTDPQLGQTDRSIVFGQHPFNINYHVLNYAMYSLGNTWEANNHGCSTFCASIRSLGAVGFGLRGWHQRSDLVFGGAAERRWGAAGEPLLRKATKGNEPNEASSQSREQPPASPISLAVTCRKLSQTQHMSASGAGG